MAILAILLLPDFSANAKRYRLPLIVFWNTSVERNNIPEYDFTTGTKMFVLTTTILLVAFIVALLFESTGIFSSFLGNH